jgi:Xylose isomerase-like TIM barrel
MSLQIKIISRRKFLLTSLVGVGGIHLCTLSQAIPEMFAHIGVVSWSFNRYFKHVKLPSASLPGIPREKKFDLLDFPALMRERYGFALLDLVNTHFISTEASYLDKLTAALAKAGCRVWNLKIDLSGSNISHPDQEIRKQSIEKNKRWLDVAAQIGSPCARVNSGGPVEGRINLQTTIEAYEQLAEYGKRRQVRIIVENHGGVSANPEAMVQIIKAVKENIATGPDTQNFDEPVRFAGLRQIFPYAATCDVKALDIGPQGEHPDYDLKRAVQIGVEAGYQGPWMIEFVGRTQDPFEGISRSRELLLKWLS